MLIRDLFYHHSHNYLIPCDHGWLMFDADWPGTLPELFRTLKSEGIRGDDVRYLMVSHYHVDHAGSAEELKQLGTTLIVMETQTEWLNGWVPVAQKNQSLRFTPISDEGNFLLQSKRGREFLAQIGIRGQILLTPGHSEDSISLLLDDGRAFTGDLPPIQWVGGIDSPAMRASWQCLIEAGATKANPAHGVPFEVKINDLL